MKKGIKDFFKWKRKADLAGHQNGGKQKKIERIKMY